MNPMLDLALREEGRLALALSEITPEHRRIPDARGGGILCRGAPGSWANVAAAIGLVGPVPDGLIDELIQWFEHVGAEPRVEITPVAHPSALRALADRGFVVRFFEHVFARPLDRASTFLPTYPLATGISIDPLDVRIDTDLSEVALCIAAGFAAPAAPSDADIQLCRNALLHPRSHTFVARAQGRIVGGASAEILHDLAALFGASVLPAYRRCGIQQSLLAARLRYAADRRCTMSTISSRPGVATEANARRAGFTLAYTKLVLVRPGPGLTPVAT